MLMAGLFKGMQMKVFKNSNGEVEVKNTKTIYGKELEYGYS
jgi:hypothetical protein